MQHFVAFLIFRREVVVIIFYKQIVVCQTLAVFSIA